MSDPLKKALDEAQAEVDAAMLDAGYRILGDDFQEVQKWIDADMMAGRREALRRNARARRWRKVKFVAIILGIITAIAASIGGLAWMLVAIVDQGEPKLEGYTSVHHDGHSYVVMYGTNRYGEAFTSIVHNPECRCGKEVER